MTDALELLRELIIQKSQLKTVCKQDMIDDLYESFSTDDIHREFWRLVHDRLLIPQDEPFTFRLSKEVGVAKKNC